jgi:hypothetical protein
MKTPNLYVVLFPALLVLSNSGGGSSRPTPSASAAAAAAADATALAFTVVEDLEKRIGEVWGRVSRAVDQEDWAASHQHLER